MNAEQLLTLIHSAPEQVDFNQVMEAIATCYHYTPTRFTNGRGSDAVINESGSNEGSCKIFAFAKLHGLNKAQTLACFGKYYRKDVLMNLGGTDHANIRTFMRFGWEGVHFDSPPLKLK